jgi:hypothetical protein
MAMGTEHVTNTATGPYSLGYDLLLDRSITVLPFIAGGASLNPIRDCNITNITESWESGQSSYESTSVTHPTQFGDSNVPKIDILHKESTAGFPKGRNSYGI